MSAHRDRKIAKLTNGPVLAQAIMYSLILFLGGCTSVGRSGRVEQIVGETPAGPVRMVINGFAVGVTDATLDRLVKVGVKQGCHGKSPAVRSQEDPSLYIIWTIQRTGLRPPAATINAQLMSAGRSISFVEDRILPLTANPEAVFEYAIGDVTCDLFRKAGYEV